jgi:hypothetical protein
MIEMQKKQTGRKWKQKNNARNLCPFVTPSFSNLSKSSFKLFAPRTYSKSLAAEPWSLSATRRSV